MMINLHFPNFDYLENTNRYKYLGKGFSYKVIITDRNWMKVELNIVKNSKNKFFSIMIPYLEIAYTYGAVQDWIYDLLVEYYE